MWGCELLLFLSADIAGSTKYKNNNPDSESFPPYWRSLYDQFYEEFEPSFGAAIRGGKIDDDLFQRPKVWKLLGDEIIFSVPINSEVETYRFVRAFLKTVREFDERLRMTYPVRLKGTAWTAGFPIRNAKLKSASGKQTDYVGPDIDIGFRVCKHSLPGRMAISMDLADILSRDDAPGNIRFFHVGWSELKGVFDDKPYPVIWISDNEDQLIPPWESDCDPWTKEMRSHPEGISRTALQTLTCRVRDSLPHLKLFPPYFNVEEMPGHHKRIMENQQSRVCIEDLVDIDSAFDAEAKVGGAADCAHSA